MPQNRSRAGRQSASLDIVGGGSNKGGLFSSSCIILQRIASATSDRATGCRQVSKACREGLWTLSKLSGLWTDTILILLVLKPCPPSWFVKYSYGNISKRVTEFKSEAGYDLWGCLEARQVLRSIGSFPSGLNVSRSPIFILAKPKTPPPSPDHKCALYVWRVMWCALLTSSAAAVACLGALYIFVLANGRRAASIEIPIW